MGTAVLAKVMSAPFAIDLIENGTVFMKKLSYYVGVESGVVGDKNEGLFYRVSDENPSLKVTASIEGGEPFPLEVKTLTIPSSARDHGVYCMYAIDTTDKTHEILPEAMRSIVDDGHMREFGHVLVVFKDAPEFVRRVEVAARESGFGIDRDVVEYVPSSHCGEMGPFRKLDSYAYQREYRLVTARPIEGDSLVLKLGPLFDIVWGAIDIDPTKPGVRHLVEAARAARALRR